MCYERLLNMCNQLDEPANEERVEEQSVVRTANV